MMTPEFLRSWANLCKMFPLIYVQGIYMLPLLLSLQGKVMITKFAGKFDMSHFIVTKVVGFANKTRQRREEGMRPEFSCQK